MNPLDARRQPFALWAAVAALTLPVLSGCATSSAAHAGAPAAAASPAVATYLPPTAPPTPVSAARLDKEAAVDFLISWVETLNYGFATGDADPLRQVTGLGCFTCAGWITDIQTQRDKGLTRDGAGVHLQKVGYLGQQGEKHLFRAALARDPGRLRAPDGRESAIANGLDVVDITVGTQTSSITGTSSWTMISILPPSGTATSQPTK